MFVVASGTEWTMSMTPTEQYFGVEVSEEAYDKLSLREQLIVDLTIEGWNRTEIADLFHVTQPYISQCIRRVAYKLADSQLRLTLDVRLYHREDSGSGF